VISRPKIEEIIDFWPQIVISGAEIREICRFLTILAKNAQILQILRQISVNWSFLLKITVLAKNAQILQILRQIAVFWGPKLIPNNCQKR
jgi:hypothetical protein